VTPCLWWNIYSLMVLTLLWTMCNCIIFPDLCWWKLFFYPCYLLFYWSYLLLHCNVVFQCIALCLITLTAACFLHIKCACFTWSSVHTSTLQPLLLYCIFIMSSSCFCMWCYYCFCLLVLLNHIGQLLSIIPNRTFCSSVYLVLFQLFPFMHNF